MRDARMKDGRMPVLWWAGEMLLALLFQLVPMLISSWALDGSELGLLIYAACLYALQPLLALLAPAFLTWKKRVNPFASFFPVGLCLIVFPAYASGLPVGLICLALGLLSAAFGAEKRAREKKKR